MENNLNGNNANQDFNLPEGFQMPTTIEAMRELVANMAKQHEEQAKCLAEHDKNDRRRKEKHEKASKIKAESRFYPTLRTLLYRRTPNPEEKVPVQDVFDYLDIIDLLSGNDNSKKKGLRVIDEHLAFYQAQKVLGVIFTSESYRQAIKDEFGNGKSEPDTANDEEPTSEQE